ncbi:hypothetical protein C0Q70_01287 [Pomacea canaliculata]|uniref:SH2 domain-containing protein n=1 Tax=Pomacea canaliculata TaxID=400727 RepID=A0A2T7PZ26_POMCA|nr:hypothetical protein C0Q70_01287 [Pomacea canaliculata]
MVCQMPEQSVSVLSSKSTSSCVPSTFGRRKTRHDHGRHCGMANRLESPPAVPEIVFMENGEGGPFPPLPSQGASLADSPSTDSEGAGTSCSRDSELSTSLPACNGETEETSSEPECSPRPPSHGISGLTARELTQARIEQDRAYLYNILPAVTSEVDFKRLADSVTCLTENCMFYADLDSKGARLLLGDSPVGTFIIRNSADPKFLFALSVMTERGATSVRIQYRRGFFQLDCEEKMRRKLPRFETVMELIDFHVAQCRDGFGEQCRWLETSGRRDMVVILTRPDVTRPRLSLTWRDWPSTLA